MSEQFLTVPLAHDESAFPIGTISYSQFVLADMSHNAEYRTVHLNDDRGYTKVPMQLSDGFDETRSSF